MNRAIYVLLATSLCAAFVLHPAVLSRAEARGYVMYDLGSLGYSSSEATHAGAINNNNWIAGESTQHAFLWRSGAMTDLIPGPGYGYAEGISDSGYVVGGRAGQAFIWHDDALTYLPGSYAVAYGVNDSGVAVGRASSRPVVWSDGQATDLGSGSGSAYAINNAGQIVGTCGSGFLWDKGSVTWLAGLSDASDINDLGSVAGSSALANYNKQACIWRKGSVTYLGTFGGVSASASAINNRDQVVGSVLNANYTQRAFVWDNGLGTILESPWGYHTYAYDVNDAGWVVGSAYETNGRRHPVLWVPVPEPTSMAALLVGLFGLGIARRKTQSRSEAR